VQLRPLRSLIIEGGLATAPCAAALAVLGVGAWTDSAVAVLSVITLACAAGLLVAELARPWRFENLARVMFFGGVIVWYAYPAVVSGFISGYGPEGGLGADSTGEIKVWALLCVSAFLMCGGLTMILLRRRREPETPTPWDGRRVDRVVGWCAIAACFTGLATYVILGGGLDAIISGILEGRSGVKPWLQQENLGDAVSALTFVTSSAMVAGATLALAAAGDRARARSRRIGIGLLGGFVSLIIYFDHGTRSLLLLVIGPSLILWWASRFRRSKTVSFAALAVLAPALFVIFQVQMLYRMEGTRSVIGELLFDRWLTLGGTIDFFGETLIALELVPDQHDYFRESVLLQFLTSPIPRFLWPGKPSSELVWYYSMQRWNVDIYVSGGNVLPGVIGQFYMSWGMIGPPLAGILLGLILVGLERWLRNSDDRADRFGLAAAIMVCLWVFVSFRQLSPGFAYPVFAMVGIVWFGKRRALVGKQAPVWSRGRNAHWTQSTATRPR
jgi:oligosaccharide repeat unit polymerase